MYFIKGQKYNQHIKSDLVRKDIFVLLTTSKTIVCVMLKSLKMADLVLRQEFVAELEPHLQDSHSLKKTHKCNLISILHITKTSLLIRFAVCNIKCCTLMLHIEQGTKQHFPHCRRQQK